MVDNLHVTVFSAIMLATYSTEKKIQQNQLL